MRRVSLLGTAAFLAASLASAQSNSVPNSSGAAAVSSGESSSLQFADSTGLNSLFADPAAAPSGGGSASAAGQQYGREGVWSKAKSNFTFEAGGGFNAPESNSITYGGNFTVGGGLNFTKHLAMLAEYQFIGDKLPGYLISEAGAQGGDVHIWSLTLDPVLDLFPKSSNDVYVTGGGGFYRKVTNFTDPTDVCYIYYYEVCGTENEVVGHFSSNQGGWNVGAGFQHRLGGMYGDSRTRLFIEARYVDVLTPAVIGATPNGLSETSVAADTKMIPVSFGIRF
jgi:hypothetical protein